jgi:glucosyl-3-phosphoglycerate phosphatase
VTDRSGPARIVVVRHGETGANLAGLWQGATDTELTDDGREQVRRLGERIAAEPPDLVVSSDLGRAVSTAEALGMPFETDPRWREPDLGTWEGRPFDEIRRSHADDLAALARGDDIALGGGERISGVAERTTAAFEHLAGRIGPGGSAVVVSHGVAIVALVASVAGIARPAPLRMMANTGIGAFSVGARGVQLLSYNDTAHLDDDPPRRPGETDLVLVRHGETSANVEQRWQGHGDWPLNEVGLAQAADAAAGVPHLDALYTSPLLRALHTAQAIGGAQRLEPVVVDDLKEIGFGAWENLTTGEIAAASPEEWGRLMAGEDVVRGGHGETFAGARERMTAAIGAITERHPEQVVGVVSHGTATSAYVTGLLGLGFADRPRLHSLANTALGRVAFTSRGSMVVSWNTGRHLAAARRR